MTDPRALLDAYARQDPADGDYGPKFQRDHAAPEAIAALRAALRLSEKWERRAQQAMNDGDDSRRAAYGEAAEELRLAITKVLEGAE